MYLGPPGLLIQVRDPLPGFDMAADRGGAKHTTLSGGLRVDYPGKHPRTFSPSWNDMNDDEYAVLEKLYLRQYGPGPFVFIPEPARWNFLAGGQSSGAETGDTSCFTVTAGVLTSDTSQSHSGFRSLKWVTTATAGITLVNNAPNNALPYGFATPPSTNWCYSAWVRSDSATQQWIAQINWFTSAGVYISTTSGSIITPAINTWAQVSAAVTSPSNAVFGIAQIAHVNGAAVNVWVDEQMLEFNKTTPGTHLAGRGQPLVSFTEFGESYDWANYGGTAKHTADGTFVEVS